MLILVPVYGAFGFSSRRFSSALLPLHQYQNAKPTSAIERFSFLRISRTLRQKIKNTHPLKLYVIYLDLTIKYT
jgi:hypothetical protein